MSTKRCNACERELSVAAFSAGSGVCRECRAAVARHRGREVAQTVRRAADKKMCVACGIVRPAAMFKLHASKADGLVDRCMDCKGRPAYDTGAADRHHVALLSLLHRAPAFVRGNIGPRVQFGLPA